jgi:hypothetical protein
MLLLKYAQQRFPREIRPPRLIWFGNDTIRMGSNMLPPSFQRWDSKQFSRLAITGLESFPTKLTKNNSIVVAMYPERMSGNLHRHLSSNIMGYSPMAPTGTGLSSANVKHIPTQEEVAMAGGVWAPTSAKRDKIAELRVGLLDGQESLDDAATMDQLLDLHLADGMKLIAKVTDAGLDVTTNQDGAVMEDDTPVIAEFLLWLNNQLDQSRRVGDSTERIDVNQTQLEASLQIVNAKLNNILEKLPPSTQSLNRIRDFLDPASVKEDELTAVIEKSSEIDVHGLDRDKAVFQEATIRYRLLLVKAAVDLVEKSWKMLTTVSDADIDRAAVNGLPMAPQVDTVCINDVYKFLESYAKGSCSERVTAAWKLLDRDGDGRLDENEMNNVAFLCLGAEQSALVALFQDALDAYPVRVPPIDDDVTVPSTNSDRVNNDVPAPKGWRQRRIETSTKKTLSRMFEKSCKNHFTDEVEINHRLRCIYAWADKAHQNNNLESIMVDADGWSGRKRFVELSPKISEAEFREVQKLHFTHLDRIGSEIVKSFREDLWVMQGKGRDRRVLVRDSLLFLTVVTLVDIAILAL